MKEKILNLMKDYEVVSQIEERNKEDSFLKIESYTFLLKNGRTVQRDIVKKPRKKAIMVIPQTEEERYIMVIQPRPCASRHVTIEFPAGYVEEGETEEEAGLRELQEETGYQAKKIHTLYKYYQDVACLDSTITLLEATGCKKVSNQHLDEGEMVTFLEVTYLELLQLLEEGLIVDANTLLAIFYLKEKKNQ